MTPTWILILSNNDCDLCDDSEAIEEVTSEIYLGTSAILLLRSDLTSSEALTIIHDMLKLTEDFYRRLQ